MKKEKMTKNFYDRFVREARGAGFIDDQLDFIWDWMTILVQNPETFTHEDNFVKEKTTCPNCEGRGDINIGLKICHVCKGTGFLSEN